jgi:hypothetical protein
MSYLFSRLQLINIDITWSCALLFTRFFKKTSLDVMNFTRGRWPCDKKPSKNVLFKINIFHLLLYSPVNLWPLYQ